MHIWRENKIILLRAILYIYKNFLIKKENPINIYEMKYIASEWYITQYHVNSQNNFKRTKHNFTFYPQQYNKQNKKLKKINIYIILVFIFCFNKK